LVKVLVFLKHHPVLVKLINKILFNNLEASMDEDKINYLTTLSIMTAELTIINTRLINVLFLEEKDRSKYAKEILDLQKEKKILLKTLGEYLKKG
jgi:hypothetical protein